MKQVETFLETITVKVDSLYESTLTVENGYITPVNPSYYDNTQIITVVSPDEDEYVIDQAEIDAEALVTKWAERFAELGEDADAFWEELTNGELDPPQTTKKKTSDITPNQEYLSKLQDELEGATLAKKLEIFEELEEAHESSCVDYVRKVQDGVTDDELEHKCINLEAGKKLAAILIAEQLTK